MPNEVYRRVLELGVLGGLGFWIANFAISLTPIAADYRAALSISYYPMLLEALLGGLVIGFLVSYFLVRFSNRVPTESPMVKSIILSLVAFAIFTAFLEVPSKFLSAMSDAMHYFLVGTLFNVVRILALGVVIGYLYGRLNRKWAPDFKSS